MNTFFSGVAVTSVSMGIFLLIRHFAYLWQRSKQRIIKNRRVIRLMDRDSANQRKAEQELSSGFAIKKLSMSDRIGLNSTIL